MIVRMGSNRNAHSLLMGIKNGIATLEDSFAVSCKTKYILPDKPAIMAPWYLPKELKPFIYTKTYTQMFIAVLFIIAKTWKQLRYL